MTRTMDTRDATKAPGAYRHPLVALLSARAVTAATAGDVVWAKQKPDWSAVK